MSSKIHRGGGAAAQPVEWRSLGGAAVRPNRSHSAASEPGQAPGPPRDVDARAAYQQGFAAGESAEAQRAQSRLEPALAGLNAIVTELAGMRKKVRAEAEQATVALA